MGIICGRGVGVIYYFTVSPIVVCVGVDGVLRNHYNINSFVSLALNTTMTYLNVFIQNSNSYTCIEICLESAF